MKDSKVIKTIFTLLVLGLSTQVMAKASMLLPEITIAGIGVSKSVKVVINDLKQDAKVQIADDQGVILISEDIEGPAFARLYNLELLKPGKYKVSVLTGQKEVEQPLSIGKSTLKVDSRLRREFLLPMVELDQKVVNVMLLNSRITDVTVRIKDDSGDLVYEDKLGAVVKVEKQYDVKALDRGIYQVVIETPERTYYHDIYND